MLSTFKKSISHRHPIRLSWHVLKAFIAAARYGFPARGLHVTGITGTDGKTTVVGMTAHILTYCGVQAGALSTAFFQIGMERLWNSTQKTSPSPFTVQKFLRHLRHTDCTHAVIEYSSHGLVQHRTAFTWPRVAAITNTSLEHLDYHGTMEQYRKDKGMLFEMLRRRGTKVLNIEDDTFTQYSSIPSKHTILYSSREGAIYAGVGIDVFLMARDVRSTSESTAASIILRQGSHEEQADLTLPIPGVFNLENALCAISCAVAAGLPFAKSIEALESFHGIPGRIERISAGQSFHVYIDFTVTPVAYDRTLCAVRRLLPDGKRILVLTGSCGDRMKEKRPLVGKICSELADVVVVTNEDPYTEDPQKIIDDVWAGIDHSKCDAYKIFDRREAMKFIFSKAQPGDAVLLCGKGSDTTMWLRNGQVPWNEREIAMELLKNI